MGRGRQIRIPGGRDVVVGSAPRQQIESSVRVRHVALELSDYPGVQPALRVQLGEHVRAGQTLFVDVARPTIAFTAPTFGTVEALRRDAAGALTAVVLRVDADAPSEALVEVTAPEPSRAALSAALQRHGLWPAFRTRPFGDIPDPHSSPVDILVTAIDTRPLAVDPRVVIAEHREAFERGLQALGLLTDGRVLVCQAPGPLLSPDAVTFAGRHPAGLPGTHVRALCALDPSEPQQRVWTLEYQDAIAVGYLSDRGQLWTERVISIAGPAVRSPRLVRTLQGASLQELAEGELGARGARLISGSALDGRCREFLGRRHLQLTALFDAPAQPPGPIIPVALLERALPLSPAPVPLLRALSTGDAQHALTLGALDLLEEDVALASHGCRSRADYGALLRHVLEQSRAEPRPLPEGLHPLDAYRAAPPLRALSGARSVRLVQLLAIAPVLWALVSHGGQGALGTFTVALLTALGWQALFGVLRGRRSAELLDLHACVTATSLAVLLPEGASAAQVALGASFGVVFAEQLFGGYGFNFVSAGAVALAFVGFGYPELAAIPGPALHPGWVAPGALLLLGTGLCSPRVLLGLGVGVVSAVLAQLLLAGGQWPAPAAVGALGFACVFLAADPVASASTGPGRWLYGLFAGSLLGLLLTRGDPAFALPILLAQLFAPLFDQLAVSAFGRRGRFAHG